MCDVFPSGKAAAPAQNDSFLLCIIKIMDEVFAFRVALSVSYVCLFVVLTRFNYEVMFRTGVLSVAVAGFFFPILYLLPYVFIVWRVLVGLNVSTNRKLYIARCIDYEDMDKADFSNSTTLNHWAVVIQDGGRYVYTQAVGDVVLGKGIKKHFEEVAEDVLLTKYRLNHVGYVTQTVRGTKTKELVDDEPEKTGNTCQEFAVDIAFQLSSSRTYTFVKIMALPRIRNTVFYIAVILSTLSMVLGYPFARLVNPLFLANLFSAWELSRIGIHNERQKNDLGYIFNVIRAYIIYPSKGNILGLMLVCVSLAYIYQRLGIHDCIVICSSLSMFVIMLLKT